MKRVLLPAILLVFLFPAGADDLGFSLGPWSFAGGVDPGTYAGAGLVWGFSPRLEAELVAVGELTPLPGNTFLGGGLLSISLLGPRIPTYFNAVLDLGYLHGLAGLNPSGTDLSLRGAEHRNFLFLRLSPLAIGNPHYRMRDRIFSAGVLYSLEEQKFSLVWSWLIYGRYFS